MLFVTHLAAAAVVGRRPGLPAIPLLVGAAAPDLIDKPLGAAGVTELYHSVGHSALALAALLAVALYSRAGAPLAPAPPATAAVAAGWASHLLLDAVHVALNGRPGVRTARFAGPDATPDDNKHKLLEVLEGVDDRRARFRTVVALVDDAGTAHTFEGVCEGTITTAPRGDGGFGYDPLFRPKGHDQTFAEMPPAAKNDISHRRKALDALRQFLVSGE